MLRSLRLYLANPRGFCAGVERAINMVEEALKVYGAPVYVRHEIVHNRFVVESLKAKGVIFINDLDEVEDAMRPAVLSAHGVAKAVVSEGQLRSLNLIDATCPLVSKVHREAEAFYKRGLHILLVGHGGHPEVDGTMGQLARGSVTLIESTEDAVAFEAEARGVDKNTGLAYITQTTLSVGDTTEILEILRRRFPGIVGPKKSDICYATTNRQRAVQEMARHTKVVFVIGSGNSSNSLRLVELARQEGCKAELVENAGALPWGLLGGVGSLGITAGASAPEVLLEEIIERLRERYDLDIASIGAGEEAVYFRSPPITARNVAALASTKGMDGIDS